MKYATAGDFRRALIDHLNQRARREGVPVGRLQKQVAVERFLVGLPASPSVLAGPPLGGYRFRVDARVDGRRFDRFPLDVGQGDFTVRSPDRLPGRIGLAFAGLPPLEIPVYPLEDHFAEKLHAYTTPRERPTRVKDPVDLLLLIELGLRPTRLLRRCVEATFERNARHPLPERLPEPPHGWRASFGRLAEETALATLDLEAAFAQVDTFHRDLQDEMRPS